jgi:hypothetical protein
MKKDANPSSGSGTSTVPDRFVARCFKTLESLAGDLFSKGKLTVPGTSRLFARRGLAKDGARIAPIAMTFENFMIIYTPIACKFGRKIWRIKDISLLGTV